MPGCYDASVGCMGKGLVRDALASEAVARFLAGPRATAWRGYVTGVPVVFDAVGTRPARALLREIRIGSLRRGAGWCPARLYR